MPTGQDEVRAGRPSTQQPLAGIPADTKTAAVVRVVRVARRSPLPPGIEAGRPASPTRKDRVARRTIPVAADSVLRRKERIASPQVSGAHPMAHSGPALTSAKSYACAYDTHPKVEYVPINQPGREVDCRGQSMVPRRCVVSGLAGSGTQLGMQPAGRRSTDAGPRGGPPSRTPRSAR